MRRVLQVLWIAGSILFLAALWLLGGWTWLLWMLPYWCLAAFVLLVFTYRHTRLLGFAVAAAVCVVVAVVWFARWDVGVEFAYLASLPAGAFVVYHALRALRASPAAQSSALRTVVRETVVVASCLAGTVAVWTWPWFPGEGTWYDEAKDSTAVAGFAGCYELAIGRWIPPYMPGHDDHRHLPRRIHLDTIRSPAPFERYSLQMRPESFIYDSSRRSTQWLPTSPEAVQLTWSTGFSGVSMRLRRAGNELRGTALASTDFSFGPLDRAPRASVTARRIECALVPATHWMYPPADSAGRR